MLLECISLAVCTLVAAYLYLRRNFDFWKNQSVPYDKPLPFFGSRIRLFLFLNHEGEDTDRVYRKFYDSPYAGIFEGDEPVLVLKNPRLIKEFFVNELSLPLKRRLHQDENNAFTQSVIFTSGPRWKFLRSTMSRGFTTARMKTAFLQFQRNATILRDALLKTNGRAIEASEVTNCFIVDNIASWVFGLDVNCTARPENEFRRQMNQILGPDVASHLGRLSSWFLQPLFKPLKLSFPSRDWLRYLDKVVNELMASGGSDDVSYDGFFQRLLHIKDEETQSLASPESFRLTTDMVTANSFALMVAGSDTSGASMAFCLLELALNLDVQERLYSEIRTALERGNGTFTYESFQNLKYLDMVISETLRKWPPAVAIGRVATASFIFPGTNVVLKPGAGVLVPIFSLHRDPKYYPDPDKFNPERFNEDTKAQREPYTYLPFSAGPRICIGLRVALLHLKIGIAEIVSNFEVQTCSKTKLPVQITPSAFSVYQKGGTWLRFIKRNV